MPINFEENRIIQALEKYRESRPTISDWKLQVNKSSIETGWFRDHKGEVILKIIIDTQKKPPAIIVLQKIDWLIFFSKESPDTEWAHKTKQALSQFILTP